MKTLTNKQQGIAEAKILSQLPICKQFSVVAVNCSYNDKGERYCELYSRKTRKRKRINTNTLFNKPSFLLNQNEYISYSWYFIDIIAIAPKYNINKKPYHF